MPRRDNRTELPTINRWLMDGFERHFLPRYLRKHFHVVACNRSALTSAVHAANTSLVVYCNHASWWDPMLALYLRSQTFHNHKLYAPIDAAALEQYKIFKSMGFYGVASSHRGAAEFLNRSLRILQTSGSSIWITPEGKFCDPRQLDEPLQPGLAHMAHAISRPASSEDESTSPGERPNTWFIPTAIEYTFWEERLPECLCWFGQPTQVQWHSGSQQSKAQWHQMLTDKLRETQRELAAASIARDTSRFEVILRGKVGSWSLYDLARRSWARLRGKQLQLEHSGLWT